MKTLKNIAKSLLVASLFASLSIQAASTSQTFQPNTLTNFSALIPGSVKVTQIIATSSTTNVASFQLVDTPTNSLTFVNSAYTNVLSYVTNYVTLYTNYLGATNTFTNLALVDVANTVAASTNNYNIPITLNVNTNSTVTAQSVNYYFNRGLWVNTLTNNAGGSITNAGPVTITITYQQ